MDGSVKILKHKLLLEENQIDYKSKLSTIGREI